MPIAYSDIQNDIPATVGEQTRINHTNCDAGTDTRQRLYIKRTAQAIIAYCHNCSGHLVRPTKNGVRHSSVVDALIRQSSAEEAATTEASLPDDVYPINDGRIPTAAIAWLYSNQVSLGEANRYGICYSPSWGRVILPVYDENGKLVHWQGRLIEGKGEKYISMRTNKKPLFLSQPPTRMVVICEDVLSAIRTGMASSVYTGVALLGTSGPDNLAQRIDCADHIAVWLDDDVAGRLKAADLAHRLKLISNAKDVWCIHAPEPKKPSAGTIIDTIANSFSAHP